MDNTDRLKSLVEELRKAVLAAERKRYTPPSEPLTPRPLR
jgi:hypothetical protein